MAKGTNKPSYEITVIDDKIHLTDSLVHGLTIGDNTYKKFTLRESTAADLFAADEIASAHHVNRHDAAVLCQQLVCIGDYDGPFTLEILGKLKQVDFEILRAAMVEVELAGKPEPKSGAAT